MKKLLIILIFLLGCTDPEVTPDEPDDTFYPCNIDSTHPYFQGIKPDHTSNVRAGHIIYEYDCIPVDWTNENRSVTIDWQFDTCWAYKITEDNECK